MPYLAQHEALLRRLYVGEDRELSATMTYMKDHYPTRKHPAERTYERFFEKKSIRKNWKASYCLWVCVQRHRFQQQGIHADLYIDGQRIEEEVIERRIARLVSHTNAKLIASGTYPPTQKPEGYEFRVNNLATLAADPGQNSSVDTSDLQESSSLLDDEGSPPTSPQDTSEDEARLAPRSPPQEVGVPAQQTSPTLVESIVPRPLSAQTLPRYTQYRDKEMLVEILRSLNACSGILPAHEMSVTQLDKMHETLALSILATAKDPVTTITAGGWQQYLRVAFMALTAVYARKISNLRRALTLFDPRRDDGNLLMAALFLAIRNGANDFVKLLLETFGRSQGRLICRVQDFLAPAAFERVEDGSPMSSPWMPSVPRGHLLNREPDQQAATVILNGLYKTARDQNYTEQGPICIQSLSTTALSQRITALHGIENGFDICQVFRFAGVDVEYIPSGTPHINVDDLLSEGPLSQEAYRKPTGGANAGVEFSNMGQRG